MKSSSLTKRINNLSARLSACGSERFAKLCFESLNEADQKLFEKLVNLDCDRFENCNVETLLEHVDLHLKSYSVMLEYLINMFRYVLLSPYKNRHRQVYNWFFNLHFYNFFVELFECYSNVSGWSETDFEEFIADLEKNPAKDAVFIIPKKATDLISKHADVYEEQETKETIENSPP